jgi:predicted metal-binding membrane protein
MTPEKRACLQHCRNPIDFLMMYWRPGATGSFGLGVHHGWYCLGCCWALMIVLFAVGLMNLVWVAAISAVILVEKTAWGGVALARVTGVLLILVGGYSAL